MKSINKICGQALKPLLFTALVGVSINASASSRTEGRDIALDAQAKLNSLKLATPLQTVSNNQAQLDLPALHQSLHNATGRQQVIVRFTKPSSGKMGGGTASHRAMLEGEQSAFISRTQLEYPSVRVLAKVQHVLNAVFLDVPAESLAEIADDPEVMRIAPVGNYTMELSETVPYVGGTAVQATGLDGKGSKVAVLDSGIDYIHADLGGSGDPVEYANNDPAVIEPGTFPTAKVVGGYDFVGSTWPDTPEVPDPDPLDDGIAAGHGSHVADIIGGANGMAPGADLYAVKVCSSISSSCSGIALIQGMDFSVDPDGDGDTSDKVDIINMSLGSNYGQAFDDDLSAAVENASALGVLTVSSAGNCSDLPYCTGSPSSAPSAVSVAQTNVPSAVGYFMNVLEPDIQGGLYDAVLYTWTPAPTGLITGTVQYGDLDGTNLDGCLPFTGDLTGMIVAVDRGACAFSLKLQNIEAAGGMLGIVMLIAPGAPFAGSFGGGDPVTIPGFNVDQATGDILRTGTAVVEFAPELSESLVGSTVSSSARGPDMSYNAIKPEIGAPGASISAQAGTGTVTTPFGGTSGASPMVAGAAALLQQQCREPYNDDDYRAPGCAPFELKALLMNNGFRDVISDTTDDLAEITRIGGGELRVDQSASANLMAYSLDDLQPALSLDFVDAKETVIIRREVVIKNLSKKRKRVTITPTFRFEDDAASGAVKVSSSKRRISVPPRSSKVFKVTFTIDPSLLGGNTMSSGSDGNNPAVLTAAEYDGYLLFEERRGEQIALPWHVLPRQAASIKPERETIVENAFPDTIALLNEGAGTAQNDPYAIIALSDEQPRGAMGAQSPTPDIKAVGVNTFIVDPTVCTSEFIWAFAVNTWDRQTHLVPVSHQVTFDIDQDGIDDYLLLNRDVTLTNVSDGRQLSWVVDLATGDSGAFFFAEHATNTGNTVLLACGEQLGLTSADILATNVDISITAQDFYFGGPGDFIDDITVTPLGERFFGAASGDLAAAEPGTIDVFDFGPWPGNTEESGVMLITNGDRGPGAHGGATEETEAILLLAPEAVPPAPLED